MVVAATVLFLGRIWVLASKVHTSISLGLRVTKLFTYNEALEVSAKCISSPSSFWCFCWTGFCKGSELFTETDLFHIGFESCVDTHALARPRGKKDDCLIVSVENALKSNNQVCSNSLLLRVSGIFGRVGNRGKQSWERGRELRKKD